MFDNFKVDRRNKGEVKYSKQTEKVIPKDKQIKQIKVDVEKIEALIRQLQNPYDTKNLKESKFDKLYLLVGVLESKIDIFLKNWPHIPQEHLEDADLYSQIESILEIYNENMTVQKDPNSPIVKFLHKIKPKNLTPDLLNSFLDSTVMYFKPISIEHLSSTELFKQTRLLLKKLDKELLSYSKKGYDLNYFEHQMIAKYNVYFFDLLTKISKFTGDYNSFITSLIPQILIQLDKITLQSSAVINLRKTLHNYLEKKSTPIQKPQRLEHGDNVISINKNRKGDLAKSA